MLAVYITDHDGTVRKGRTKKRPMAMESREIITTECYASAGVQYFFPYHRINTYQKILSRFHSLNSLVRLSWLHPEMSFLDVIFSYLTGQKSPYEYVFFLWFNVCCAFNVKLVLWHFLMLHKTWKRVKGVSYIGSFSNGLKTNMVLRKC